MRAIAILAPALAVLLSGCGNADESGPGGVTTAESKALDEAAEMIEQQRLPQEALRPPAPADTATSAPAPAN